MSKITEKIEKHLTNEESEGEFDLGFIPDLIAQITSEALMKILEKELKTEFSKGFKLKKNWTILGNKIQNIEITTPKGKKMKFDIVVKRKGK